jgi:hypothetical protein
MGRKWISKEGNKVVTTLGKLSKTLFGIPSEKAVFSRPGFAPEAWLRFQPVAHSLVEGYHATLEDSRFEVLVPRLNAIDPELHGFAYEGAGMGIAALDIMTPWKNRLEAFVGDGGPAAPHIYPTYVGVGLALARLRRNPERFLVHLDPLLRWVVVDGYGFHEAFFSWKCTVEKQRVPAHFSSYALRLFDQGVGRAIWFASGAGVKRVTAILATFPAIRQAELWSGVGLASAYAGGGDRLALETVLKAAGPYQLQLARGAAIAARGRHQAGNLAPHTRLACEVYSGLSSEEAFHITNVASENLPTDAAQPAYEIWRQRIQDQLVAIGHVGTMDPK